MGFIQTLKDLFKVNTYKEIARIENNIRILNCLPKPLRIHRVYTMNELDSKYKSLSRSFNSWETIDITDNSILQSNLLNQLNTIDRLYIYPTKRCLYCVTATADKGRIRIQFDWDGDFFSFGIENSGYRYDIHYMNKAILLIRDWVDRVIHEIEPQFKNDIL